MVLAERGPTGSFWASPLGCGRNPISLAGGFHVSFVHPDTRVHGSHGPAPMSACFTAAHRPWQCWARHSHCAPAGVGCWLLRPCRGDGGSQKLLMRLFCVPPSPGPHPFSCVKGLFCGVFGHSSPPHYVNQHVSCRAFFLYFSRSILVGKA